MHGDRLKQLRMDKGLSQQKLADLLGVDRTTIGKYELKNVTPNTDVLKKMSTILNTTESFLMGFSKEEALNQVKVSPEDLELIRQIKNLPARDRKVIDLLVDLNKQVETETKQLS